MAIPEHNLCVRNSKWRKAINHRRKPFGHPKLYHMRHTCKTWRRYRLRQVLNTESYMLMRDSMKELGVSTVREWYNVVGLRYSRYGKYDDM